MHLSDRAIQCPRLVFLGSALFCGLGIAAVFSLPKERTPRVKLPVIVVDVSNPGSAPDGNERNIVRKLEDEIAQSVEGLKDEGGIISQATHGSAIIQIIFENSVKVDDAKRDVESAVNRIKGEFPLEAQSNPGPTVKDIAFEDWPIIQVLVAGGADGTQRRQIAERLKDQIKTNEHIAAVDLFGGLESEVQVEVDPHLMVHYGFSSGQVVEAIQQANEDMPTGNVETDHGSQFQVRARSKLASITAIEQIPIGVYHGNPVMLADFADVQMGHKKLTTIARYGGEDAVMLLVRGRSDIDVLATANAVQQIVDQFDPGDPSISLGTVRSQAREIGFMIKQLGTSALYGTILVVVFLWLFLGWRNAALMAISVPFALLVTAAFIWLTKQMIAPSIAINTMTLLGTILVIGLVVDGCIIVGENIYRHRQLGASPVHASRQGIAEVGPSLIGAYLTTFAAFAPMFLVQGIMGDFLQVLPIVVIFALCAAMIVDHFLIPVLSMYFMKVTRPDPDHGPGDQPPATHSITPKQSEMQKARDFVTRRRPARIYGHMVRKAMAHRVLVFGMIALAALTPVGLYGIGAIGVEFFPDADYAAIQIHYELPRGASMEKRTVPVSETIEQAVMRAVHPDEWYKPSPDSPRVKPVTAMGNPGAMNTRLDRDRGAGPEFGMVDVELELASSRERSLAEIRDAIRAEIPAIPDVSITIESLKDGPPVGAPVVVRILAHEHTSMHVLIRRAAEVEQLLQSIPGTYDIRSDCRMRPEFVVTPDRVQASLFDMDVTQIGSAIHFGLEGIRLGEVDFGGNEEKDLRVRHKRSHRNDYADVTNMPLRNRSGYVVILEQVADIQRSRTPDIIRHYDQRRVVNIQCELETGILVDDVKARLAESLSGPEPTFQSALRPWSGAITAPTIASDSEVQIEFGGETEIRDDAMHDLKVALIVGFSAMLIILVMKFNSFIQPLIVLISVPLSIIGVALGLAICGFNFSVAAMIGVVALSGIVVNDAIVLVDFINRTCRAGVPIEDAVVYAGQVRLRPIMLTTATTIAGLLPLALNVSGGGEFWQPLTVSIIFGLGVTTLLQLFIVPLAYYSFNRRRRTSLLDPMQRPDLAGPEVQAAMAA